MIKNRLITLPTELLNRAQKIFERKSGWKSTEVRSTLTNFSRLDGVGKVLFGSLLVGQAFRRLDTRKNSLKASVPLKTRKRPPHQSATN